ncbi:LOW QUALITY PROTEIN: heterogeneous nuclear ribonucleoprotein U-like protein 1 [Drosophila serrata]|uniref:LOW QUALITY PROTEIN: heterogeneous nuclear ribonucleoprotein U-like protein 1 n=1 Tax=Drosophila serrata TaxID=7274 RepID=UPI000A1D127B|nr:LOW QUALITY PROTEIN: heterogeneous nuclear ribonucleoprotein U-like protein 1 [Drosophila serrata]
MDVAKLEKMKVVDLRNELQSRGLDTKGVKAVLIERLRAHVEGGAGDGDGAPVTPSRRQRRTRSMSRSPSPVAAAPVAVEPILDTLEEEEPPVQTEQLAPDAEPEPESQPEPEPEEEPEQEAEDTSDTEVGNDEPQPQAEESDEKTEIEEKIDSVEKDEAPAAAEIKQDDDEPMEEVKDAANEDEAEAKPAEHNEEETAVKMAEEPQENGDSQKMDVDDESTVQKTTEDAEATAAKSEDQHQERRKRSHSRSRSRSGSRSPKHRSSVSDKRDSKAVAEERTVPEDEPTIEENKVGLSWLDSDLHLRIDPTTFASAKPLSTEIYSLIWSGARSNFGVREGKVCYEVRLAEEVQSENSHYFRDEPHVRGFRVGFSKPQSTLLLGEAEHSFGYCETGRKANQGEFSDYGKPYKLDDVIGCYLDLESEPCTIKYTLNGEDLGVAFEFEKSILGEEEALFPHIVTKGYEYSVNFSDNEQLLVNAERPTRKRRKPRKEEDKDDDKDDNDGEKWKVLDEATADDDELEKKDEEDGKTNSEQADEAENSETAKEAEKQSGETAAEDKAEAEAAKPSETSEAVEASATDEASGEAETVANGNATAEKVNDEKAREEQKPSTANEEEEDEDGPSPNKRPKTDEDSEKGESEKDKEKSQAHTDEDEYEDVAPEPRETAALLDGYVLVGLVSIEQLRPGPQRAGSRKECEVILLVGLPGSGKTHWALKHVAENVDKRYDLIGPDAFIAKMTIDGASRKTVHKGRWDKVYETCLNSLAALEDIAMKRRRNFILDQTNVYASAQRRKMKGFNDFKRIAVVCIPSEDELKRRIADKEEKGNAFTVKESTINNLRANFTLPSLEFGWFDDINYTELTGDEAKSEVKKYNEKGKKAIDAERSRDKRSRGGRDNYRRDDRNRNRYNDDRRRDYGGQRHESRWSDARRGGGGGGSYSSNSGAGGGGSRGYDNRRSYSGSSGGQQNWMQNSRRSGYDDRGYGGGSGGGGNRGYDNRNRGYGGSSGGGGQQNWMQNNRNRSGYDDRSYGSSRDYRDRDRGNDRSRMGSNDRNRGSSQSSSYRSGGGTHQQRDFRPGHRDTKEDSRGGYERSAGQSLPKYGNNSAAGGGYDQYKQQSGGAPGGGKASLSGKWSTYTQHQQQTPQHQQTGVWQTQQQSQQYQQQHQQQTAGQQQQYWGYNQMAAGYGNQQQQTWQSAADPQQQQQQWMSWWQQQQQGSGGAAANNASGGAGVHVGGGAAGNNDGGATNHYWSQYSYSTQSNPGDKK